MKSSKPEKPFTAVRIIHNLFKEGMLTEEHFDKIFFKLEKHQIVLAYEDGFCDAMDEIEDEAKEKYEHGHQYYLDKYGIEN
jgi:CRISPR/Cas system-associated endonuclease Cas1